VNLATLQFHSPSLHRHVSYSVILPEGQKGPAPVLMQLHGYSDDHTAWLHFSNLIRHARPYPFIIVLPDGGTSYYLNLNEANRYEDFLMQDIYDHVSATFQVRPGPWAIGGLSMGGFGAMRLGLRYPDRFASVWGHSSALLDRDELLMRLGVDQEPDIYAIAAGAAQRPNGPVISFDCGTEDFLIEHNRRFHAHLEALGVAHTYREHPGAHTWEYWDEHVKAALAQHAAVLG